jgi:hypothetical protein
MTRSPTIFSQRIDAAGRKSTSDTGRTGELTRIHSSPELFDSSLMNTRWLVGFLVLNSSHRDHDRSRGRAAMTASIASVANGVPTTLIELRRLGRTLKQRTSDVLACFDRPCTSNGPTEAINGRLEHLRGSALGFRNLTNHIARSILETDGFRARLHRQMR